MGSHAKAAYSSQSFFEKELKELLQSEGEISVATYMDVVNRHYYATRDPFGKVGDFTTAPEISQLFGEVIAFSFMDFMEKRSAESPVTLIELGPGRGTLMADLLRVVNQVPGLLNQISRVTLVEISPILKAKQRQALSSFQDRLDIRWCDSVTSALEVSGTSFIIANEFLDALPLHQYRLGSENKWQERKISLHTENEILWTWDDATFGDACGPEQLAYFPKQFHKQAIVEASPSRYHVFKRVLNSLEQKGGQALFIDYGDDVLNGETLQALRHHRYVPVLEEPGEADLTSHVDFGVLKEAVKSFQSLGMTYETQRQFLKRFHIDVRLDALLRRASYKQKEVLMKGAERLTDISQMGHLFKVLCVANCA